MPDCFGYQHGILFDRSLAPWAGIEEKWNVAPFSYAPAKKQLVSAGAG